MAEHDLVTGRSCRACGQFRPRSEFNKAARGKFGLAEKCKDCTPGTAGGDPVARDIVIPLRQEAAGNYPELRYALRSLDTLIEGVGEVWILGGKPRWLQNANHIPYTQSASKYSNVRRMLKDAFAHAPIEDGAILMNDDFYYLQPQEMATLQMLHGGPFIQWLANRKARLGSSRYIQGAAQTLKLLERHGYPDALSWSLHTPLLVHKEPFLEAIAMCGDSGLPYHLRSLYGALQGLQGTKHVDVKLVGNALPDPQWKYVSTADTSFAHRPVGQMLKKRFTEPSRWELAG